jgi:hypothetical protein
MKTTFLSILLCGALLSATTVRAETTNNPPNQTALLAAFVITMGIIGVIIIIKVNSTVPDQHQPVTLVLEKSYYDGNWVPQATNTVVLNGMTPIEVFQQDMTDEVACYRARVLR